MKIMSFVVSGVLVGASLFAFSGSAQAYEAKAIALSPTHTLLVTTYSELLLNRSGIIPMSIKIGTEGTYQPLTAGYQVTKSDNTKFSAQTLGGFILSGQPIMHGGYTLDEGKRATFMLVVLITHEASNASNIRANLTTLPILITTNGEVTSQTAITYGNTGTNLVTEKSLKK
jgi:opacity protein-like surface antigen